MYAINAVTALFAAMSAGIFLAGAIACSLQIMALAIYLALVTFFTRLGLRPIIKFLAFLGVLTLGACAASAPGQPINLLHPLMQSAAPDDYATFTVRNQVTSRQMDEIYSFTNYVLNHGKTNVRYSWKSSHNSFITMDITPTDSIQIDTGSDMLCRDFDQFIQGNTVGFKTIGVGCKNPDDSTWRILQ